MSQRTAVTMPDGYYNHYDETKHRESILFIDPRVLQGAELNEWQSLEKARRKRCFSGIYRDGDIISDCQISVDAATGEVRASSGALYLDGDVRGVQPATFTIPTSGTVAVGVRMVSSVVSELEDPSLYNPYFDTKGDTGRGAWRLEVNAVWGHEADGGEGEFYPVHVVDDGVVRVKELPPNLDGTSQAIARYDRDSTGGGSYIVDGLTLLQAADVDGVQMYTVSEGRARVCGQGIDMPTSRRLSYAAVPDLRAVETEVFTADDTATQRLDVAHPPIWTVRTLRVTVRKTVSLTHGAYMGAKDALPDTAVVEILSVRMGDTVYVQGTDYKKTGDTVDWSPSGNEPPTGSTYEAEYTCIIVAAPENQDRDGFSVSGAVAGSSIIVTYDQALPRLDRLCLTQDGTFQWFQGVASESNQMPPHLPDSVLPLATVFQTWRAARGIDNDGVRVQSFEEMRRQRNLDTYLLERVSELALQSDIHTREAGAKAGMFVDPLLGDNMRDQGVEQSAAVVPAQDGGELTLAIDATAHPLPRTFALPTARAWTPKPALEQLLRTSSMQVNPYQSFEPMPAAVTLTPAVDRWTEFDTTWTSAVTRVFDVTRDGYFHIITGTSHSTGTEVVTSSSTDIANLRQIDVTFTLRGFVPGEKLSSVTFDGVAVEPRVAAASKKSRSAAAPAADAEGVLTGLFTIPPDIPAGSKTVNFTGTGGSRGSAVFTGQGTLTAQTLRQVNTTTRYWVDPLAQTFVVDTPMQLAGVDLWFTASGGDARLQIREVEGGSPSRVILAEKDIPKASMVISGGGHTRVLLDSPLTLTAGTEYALVVLADDAVTSLSIAEIGKQDTILSTWVMQQPYTIGVLLSSSNASTWTSHQDKDLTFRLLAADFGGVQPRTLEMGSVDVADATDLMLLAVSEVPSARCQVEYTLALPDGTNLSVSESQPVRFAEPLTGTVGVSALLTGDATHSGLLWPDVQVLAGTVRGEGNYVGRAVPAVGASRAIALYDAFVPSGATVTPEMQADDGAWTAMTAAGTKRLDNGYVEFRFTAELSEAVTARMRLALTGASGARPRVRNIRFMAIL